MGTLWQKCPTSFLVALMAWEMAVIDSSSSMCNWRWWARQFVLSQLIISPASCMLDPCSCMMAVSPVDFRPKLSMSSFNFSTMLTAGCCSGHGLVARTQKTICHGVVSKCQLWVWHVQPSATLLEELFANFVLSLHTLGNVHSTGDLVPWFKVLQ